MKFTEITPTEFRNFAKTSPYKSFMQTPEIAEYRKNHGWTSHYFAVIDENCAKSSKSLNTQKSPKSATSGSKILAASMVVEKPTFLGKSLFYAPGGPLLDLEDGKLATFFLENLRKYAKTHNAYALRITPYYELIQRDRDGKVVPHGFYHQKALINLAKLDFRPISDTSMPQYLFALPLIEPSNTSSDNPQTTKPNNTTKTQKSIKEQESQPKNIPADQLFAAFKQNTRNLIHRAERQGVTVRELTREELPILKSITASTADRRHFTDQPLSYYQEMYDLFAPLGEVKFLLAEVDNTLDSTKTPLSVAMFMLFGDEVVYLFSGSDEKYMRKYNAQYLIQWHMIKYATEHGFKRYNFYGIQGLPDPTAKDYGIYRFKKGFGGHVVELIGTYDLPVRKPIYYLHYLLSKLKEFFEHFAHK